MGGTLILGFSLKGPVFNPCLCYTVLFAYVLLIAFTHVTVHVYICISIITIKRPPHTPLLTWYMSVMEWYSSTYENEQS